MKLLGNVHLDRIIHLTITNESVHVICTDEVTHNLTEVLLDVVAVPVRAIIHMHHRRLAPLDPEGKVSTEVKRSIVITEHIIKTLRIFHRHILICDEISREHLPSRSLNQSLRIDSTLSKDVRFLDEHAFLITIHTTQAASCKTCRNSNEYRHQRKHAKHFL